MFKRYAIRMKSTGEFLSPKTSRRNREWCKNASRADLWSGKSGVVGAARHIPEVQKWMTETKRNYLGFECFANYPNCPIEIMEFNVLLIDASKGYI